MSKGAVLAMNDQRVGKRVRISNYNPFRGLKGTIQRVNAILDEEEDIFCFYLILLDSRREPIWFEHTEIEFVDSLPAFSRGKT